MKDTTSLFRLSQIHRGCRFRKPSSPSAAGLPLSGRPIAQCGLARGFSSEQPPRLAEPGKKGDLGFPRKPCLEEDRASLEKWVRWRSVACLTG